MECTLCPRSCGALRTPEKGHGFCGLPETMLIARIRPHLWEEPPISGKNGTGAVFFSGCTLRCAYCQNGDISHRNAGRAFTPATLADSLRRLVDAGMHTISFITATPYVPQILDALALYHPPVPLVWNTSGYETVDTLRMLEGVIDVYLPDLKHRSEAMGRLCAKAPDYFDVASRAIGEMVRQAGKPLFDEASGLMKRGVIVRHLCLPGQSKDSKKVLRYLHSTFGNDIYISIMNQYTPLPHVAEYPELNRSLTEEEYEKLLTFAVRIGIEQGFRQEGGTDKDSFIPAFDGEGLL